MQKSSVLLRLSFVWPGTPSMTSSEILFIPAFLPVKRHREPRFCRLVCLKSYVRRHLPTASLWKAYLLYTRLLFKEFVAERKRVALYRYFRIIGQKRWFCAVYDLTKIIRSQNRRSSAANVKRVGFTIKLFWIVPKLSQNSRNISVFVSSSARNE